MSIRTWTSPCAPRWSAASPNGIGGPDERIELRRRTLRDLERDVDVRPQRPVVAVILGRADRDDDRPAALLQVLAHLEVRHLRHEERARHQYPERSQVLVRAAHRLVHVVERRPGLALELELDGVRACVARTRRGSRARAGSRRDRCRAFRSPSCPCRPSCPSGARGRDNRGSSGGHPRPARPSRTRRSPCRS